MPTLHIECKGTKSPVLSRSHFIGAKGWLTQVKRDCPEGHNWIIFNKVNNYPLIAIINPRHFTRIVKANPEALSYIAPIALVGDSVNLSLELEKASSALYTVTKFNSLTGLSTDTIAPTPIIVYAPSDTEFIIAMYAEAWKKMVQKNA